MIARFIKAHDIWPLRTVCNVAGTARSALRSLIGGGLGRTPMIGKVINDFLPAC